MSVLQHFEEYQKARVKFVQAVAEAATRPQNIEVMNNAGVMQLLRPLLLDNVRNCWNINEYNFVAYCFVLFNFRCQVFSKPLLWHSADLPTTAKTWLRLWLEMKYYHNLYIHYQIKT